MKFLKINAFLAVFVVFLSGCATIFSGTSENITVRTDTDDANISVDGRHVGRGSATFEVARTWSNSNVPRVTVEKDGYRTQEFELQRNFNSVSIINLSFLYSWTTDFFTGAMYEYSPNQFMIQMVEEESAGLSEEQRFQRFVLTNTDNLQDDIARGEGEYLEAAASYSQMESVELVDAELRSSLLDESDAWEFYLLFAGVD